jgi:hypothetical protein
VRLTEERSDEDVADEPWVIPITVSILGARVECVACVSIVKFESLAVEDLIVEI